MLRIGVYVACICAVQIASTVHADELDSYFQQDLQRANADLRYAHLVKASEKVRVYRLHNYACGWDVLDPTFDGVVTAASAAQLRASVSDCLRAPRSKKGPAVRTSTQVASLSSAVPLPRSVEPPSKGQNEATPVNQPGQWVMYLRKNFSDIYSLTAPNSPPASTGATFSYSNDRIAKNAVWSGEGAIFGGYRYLAPQFGLNGQPYVLGFAAGPYYTFNESLNTKSSDVSKNINTETFGGTAELASGNFLGIDTFTAFTRVSLGDVQDNIKGTSDLSATANFVPVYAPWLVHWPHGIPTSATTDFLFRIDPTFVVQYDSIEGKNQVLPFSKQTRSLRLGPQIGVWSVPFDGVPYLENLIVNVTYHVAAETYSRQNFHWVEADLTYKLNANFGVTASYKNGNDENTGAKTNQYMISLSTALDYCVPTCPGANAAATVSQ
jgi:hypothetical protein